MNCQPLSSAKMMPGSRARFVDAISNAIAALRDDPLRNSDLASATAAYEQDDEAAPRAVVPLPAVIAAVIAAAIAGDSAGYEVGRHVGPAILRWHILDRRRKKLEGAQDFRARRGGSAVLLGRWIAFFRAVMPALAGTARMPYRTFLAWNATGIL